MWSVCNFVENFPMLSFLVGDAGVPFSLFYPMAALVFPVVWMMDGVVEYFLFQYFYLVKFSIALKGGPLSEICISGFPYAL